MKNTKTILIASLFACGLAFSAQANNIIANGGFETGDFTDWTLSGAQNYGAVYSNAHFVEVVHSGSYGVGLYGFDALPIDTLSQTVATSAGEQYTLTFWWESQATAPNNFEALWNGTPVFAVADQTLDLTWTEEEFTVTATGISSVLSFADYLPGGNGTYGLDDVSLVSAAVPDGGSSMIYLALAFLALVWLKRRGATATA